MKIVGATGLGIDSIGIDQNNTFQLKIVF